jgi:hypothetical protein
MKRPWPASSKRSHLRRLPKQCSSTTAVCSSARRRPAFTALLVTAAAGTVYLKLAEWTAAASDFECAININADMPVYHYAFAVALEHIGRRNEA